MRTRASSRRNSVSLSLEALETRLVPAILDPTATLTILPVLPIARADTELDVAVNLHAANGIYSYTVNWGDGSPTDFFSTPPGFAPLTHSFTHAYANPGIYTLDVLIPFQSDVSPNTQIDPNLTLTIYADPLDAPADPVLLPTGDPADPILPPASGPGDLVGSGSGTGSVPSGETPCGVRYGDGVAMVTGPFLDSGSQGMPWGANLSWSNSPAYSYGAANGMGWTDTQLPFLIMSPLPKCLSLLALN
jgi:hypothetical protein